MRDAQQLLTTLADGDEVITTGGIYGFITAIDGDTIWLDIAEGVEIRIHRSAISRKIDPVKEPAGGQPSDDDDEVVESRRREVVVHARRPLIVSLVGTLVIAFGRSSPR